SLFPYTTLFRSDPIVEDPVEDDGVERALQPGIAPELLQRRDAVVATGAVAGCLRVRVYGFESRSPETEELRIPACVLVASDEEYSPGAAVELERLETDVLQHPPVVRRKALRLGHPRQ